ncbi:N-acetylglucosamine kinase [Affinibrenneria salicis]|uniref:N-acetyl-D-glucosamine kinase n=1 Tax=Affinibrenneria salicis TaxID=2590031 RepID=A0A5J5G3I7_9GAMM|nr:N-acetylglucosamine kinase [Affinibrenneria salicis]KAA9001221.1 N-acetylglucosamine kinase [Affinibrenneria salicis]
MYYGFDIGGSKIELTVFDAGLTPVWNIRVATPREDYDALLHTLAALTAQADSLSGAAGKIGVGVPGLQSGEDGALFTANLPATMGRPLRRDLSQLLRREVRIANDASCFALSEAWNPACRAYPVVLGIILGTGMGGGLVVNGRLVSGRNGMTGEFGHLRLPVDALEILGRDIPRVACGCGQYGCIENYLSGRGFEWLYQHFYHEQVAAPQLIERYRAADERASEHVGRYVAALAVCLGNLLTLFDPDLLVLGGGLSNFSELYTLLPEKLPAALLPVARLPRIEKARYGDAGGVRGAALLHLMDE